MEVAQDFLKKYASATFNTCADDTLTHQYNDMMSRCENFTTKNKPQSKKGKKERIANVLCMLLKMKEIAERKELSWYSERAEMRNELHKFEGTLTVASAKENQCECDELKSEIERLSEHNRELEEGLCELEERCRLHEQHIAVLEKKELYNENIFRTLDDQLQDAKSQIIQKDQCIASLKTLCPSEACTHNEAPIYPLIQQEGVGKEQAAENPPLSLNQSPCLFAVSESDSGVEMSDPSDVNINSMAKDSSDEFTVSSGSSDNESLSSNDCGSCKGRQMCEFPCDQRRVCAVKAALRCFACKKFGHIARYCLINNKNRGRNSRYLKTAQRPKQVYSARWSKGSGRVGHNRQRQVYYQAQMGNLQAENCHLIQERHQFLAQLNELKMEIVACMNKYNTGSNLLTMDP